MITKDQMHILKSKYPGAYGDFSLDDAPYTAIYIDTWVRVYVDNHEQLERLLDVWEKYARFEYEPDNFRNALLKVHIAALPWRRALFIRTPKQIAEEYSKEMDFDWDDDIPY